jgi:hypothetical protein
MTMMQRRGVRSGRSLCAAAGVLAMLAGAPAGFAQDSVSPTSGLPGDALDAYSTSEQVNDYTVELSTLTSSWGGRFAVGPAVRSSRSSTAGFFDLLVGANVASNRFSAGPILRGSYAQWSAAGQGVNGAVNTAPGSSLSTAGLSAQQFALGFMEFDAGPDATFGTSDDPNSLVAAVVNFQARRPNRLLVSRVTAATNKPVAVNAGTASLGLGAVDELGNLHAYGDSYGMSDSFRLTQRTLIRVRAAQRNAGVVNTIQSGSPGDAGACTYVRQSTSSMTTPSIVSATIAGRPVMATTDFNSDYVFESAANTTSITKSYLPASTGSPRGNLAVVGDVFPPVNTGGAIATAATLVRTDSNTRTRGIQIFGVGPTGAPTGQLQIALPLFTNDIQDPADGFNPGTTFAPLANHEFTNWASQVPFRGGNGQVAMTVLPTGDLLLAATVTATGTGAGLPQTADNYIAVARVNATTQQTTWSVAAHSGNAAGAAGGLSKQIFGGTGPGSLAPIGRIAKPSELAPSNTAGPSLSSPAMDRRGNLYFIATVALDQPTGGPTFHTALLRANRDTATGAYTLELLAKTGDILTGQNQGTTDGGQTFFPLRYQIQGLALDDADSIDSGSIFSGSIVQDAISGAAGGSAPFGSPFSLGALSFRARIVYDINNDGQFIDPSGTGGSTSPDQSYNAVMVAMPSSPPGDFNRDGTRQPVDIFSFLNAYFASDPRGDWIGDGTRTPADIFAFLSDYFSS